MAQLMRWEELTTGRGRATANTAGNAKTNEGNLLTHIFTLTLLLYRAYKATRHIHSQWNKPNYLASMYMPPQKCTFFTGDEDEIILNAIKSCLPQVDQGIALCWVVFPQVDQNRNAK